MSSKPKARKSTKRLKLLSSPRVSSSGEPVLDSSKFKSASGHGTGSVCHGPAPRFGFMTVPGQGLSLITPHALLLIFLWRSRFVGALLRATRLELSFSLISAGARRIAVPGRVARNGAPAGRAAGLSASSRGVERASPSAGSGSRAKSREPQPGTAMRPAGRIRDKLKRYQL